MTIPINALDETKPAGSRAASLGDNDIREYKTQNREILEVNHVYPSSGQSADAGKHKMVHLIEQADLGTGAEGKPILGAQTVSGKAELLFTDEDNNDVQITSGGKIRGASVRLANDVSLTGRNQANSADVDIIKVNTSNQAQVTPALIASGGLLLPEISAPTTIVDQGALYTKNDGSQTELYFREESNGDEVKITSGGSLNIPSSIGGIKDYGTSTSSSTEKTLGNIKICYGTVSLGNTSSQAITNLPFTSNISYSVTVTLASESSSSFDVPIRVVRNSGSQFTIYNKDGDGGTLNFNWIAIGA